MISCDLCLNPVDVPAVASASWFCDHVLFGSSSSSMLSCTSCMQTTAFITFLNVHAVVAASALDSVFFSFLNTHMKIAASADVIYDL